MPSVALRLDVAREEEIRKFVAGEYWTFDVELAKQRADQHFLARLNRLRNEPSEADANGDGETETKPDNTKIVVKSEAEAQEIVRKLEGASYKVIGVDKKRRTKSSYLPYITSTLQQDASSRLRFAPRRTMRVAQDLYEGIELGDEGSTGLIT